LQEEADASAQECCEVVRLYAQAMSCAWFKQLDRTIGEDARVPTETTAKPEGAAQFHGKPIRQY